MSESSSLDMHKKIGFGAGIFLFFLMILLPHPAGLSVAGWQTAAITVLMGVWWITEAIPIPVTALLPIFLLPLLEVRTISEATMPYANPLIFLFLGGFVIAAAMERWNLHRRIALNIVGLVGINPRSIVLGFMIASAFLSMWVSNTATALMMLPIALSVLSLVEDQKKEGQRMNFEIVLVLSIAYACNVGGMGTLIGTPPNALLAGYMSENYGVDIGFLQWMLIGIPLMMISLPALYYLLVNVIYPIRIKELPGGRELIEKQLAKLGDISNAEKKVAAVFVLAALLWVSRPLLEQWISGLTDSGIAIGAALVLFVTPVDLSKGKFVLEWSDTERLPWGVLILFGGGLSLASAISETGLAEWIGNGVGVVGQWPVFLLVGLSVLVIVFLTEMTSNTATTAAFLPILASVAVGVGENPLLLAIPAALGASCAFMLPVATPPNAIVYGSGKISIPEMSKAGIVLNIFFIILLTVGAFTLIQLVFDVTPGVLPPWAS